MKSRNWVATFLLTLSPLAAADQWIKLTTPHFELYTSAGEKKGREAILYFEQVRSFFLQASPSKRVPEFPVRIIAFKSEKQYKPYSINEGAAAYFTKTMMRDYIVMEDIAAEHYPIAIHEYTHLIVEHSGLNLPPWLNEGWAEVYSTLKPRGDKAMVGDLIPGRVQVLLNEKWLDLATLTTVDHRSPYYNEKNKMGIFYAESWALVHMLYLSPVYGPYFGKIVTGIANGQTFAAAVEAAMGRQPADVWKDFQMYLHGNRLLGALFDVHLQKSDEEAAASTPSELEVDSTLADLLMATRRFDQAKQEFERLARENPGKPEVEESLGYLMWHQRDENAARQHFAKALAAGTNNARMCYDYAMLERRAEPGSQAASDAFERTLTIKPDYTEARLQFGLLKLQAKQWAAAVGILGQIHNVKEDQAFWLFSGLAHAYANLNERDKARDSAEKARKYAKTGEQTARADELLRYIDARKRYDETMEARTRPPSSDTPETGKPHLQRAAPPETAPPDPSQPSNPFVHPGEEVKRVEGVATQLDCDGKKATLRVSVGAATMLFAIDDPKQVLLKHRGEATFDFSCGPQKPFGVAVEYVPEPDKRKPVAGVLRALEF